ncbi:hypothetical protein N8703_04880 [Verrucomicrobia bacterium]|nr:hypothetical protein [Verrucomicrobiota bacterium]
MNSDDGSDFEQLDENGEEDEERKALTREIAEQAMNDADMDPKEWIEFLKD